MLLNPFTLHVPKTLSEAVKLYDDLDHIKIMAGGTFLMSNLKLLKKKGIKTPEHILSLQRIKELNGIREEDNHIVICAMTNIVDLQDSVLLTDHLKILKVVAHDLATTPIRNMATIGGNLTCRYTWTELPVVMIGLEVEMIFMNAQGEEEVLSAEEFFQNKAKTKNILIAVRIAKKAAVASYQRAKKSPYVDIPLLAVFIKTIFEGKKFTNTVVAVNNGADFARRDYVLEGFLNQQECSEGLEEEVLNNRDKVIYESRSTDYKKHMFEVSFKKAIKDLMEQNDK